MMLRTNFTLPAEKERSRVEIAELKQQLANSQKAHQEESQSYNKHLKLLEKMKKVLPDEVARLRKPPSGSRSSREQTPGIQFERLDIRWKATQAH